MASEMVTAIGDSGLELVAKDQAVSIPVFPMGTGNKIIPASIRFLSDRYGKPARLTGIRRAGLSSPMVTWRDENGKRGSCYLLNEDDARDTLFSSLSASSKARLLAAVAS